MENDVNSAFIRKYNIHLSQSILSGKELTIKKIPLEEQFGARSIEPLVQKPTTMVYEEDSIHDSRASGLGSGKIDKLTIKFGAGNINADTLQLAFQAAATATRTTFEQYGLSPKLKKELQEYIPTGSDEHLSALINQGINEFIENEHSINKLDDFISTLTYNIDQTAHEMGINNIPSKILFFQKQSIQGKQVGQRFEITNKDGDTVEISASSAKGGTTETNELSWSYKSLDVNITKGGLSDKEQEQFNRFFKDFSTITNAILSGNNEKADQLLTDFSAEKYGFRSIKKSDSYVYLAVDNDDILHVYTTKYGHSRSGLEHVTQEDARFIQSSYVKGGIHHGEKRNSSGNLAEFNVQQANTHEQPNSPLELPDEYDIYQDDLFKLTKQYGIDHDGLVLSDGNGQLYRYEYNSGHREQSGWRAISKSDVDEERLENEYRSFNNFKLNIKPNGDATIIYIPTQTEKDYGTKVITSSNGTVYGKELDKSVYEDRDGNLYQYRVGKDFQNSGWQKVERTEENLALLEEGQKNDGGLHIYLTKSNTLGQLGFANMYNGFEVDSRASAFYNMADPSLSQEEREEINNIKAIRSKAINAPAPNPTDDGLTHQHGSKKKAIVADTTGTLYEYKAKNSHDAIAGWHKVPQSNWDRERTLKTDLFKDLILQITNNRDATLIHKQTNFALFYAKILHDDGA